MRRSVAAGLAGALTTAGLTAALVVPSEAQQHAQVIRFTDTELTANQVGPATYVATGVNRSGDKVVGSSLLRGRLSDGQITVDAAFARRGGLIYVTIRAQNDDVRARGRVTGGTGVFEGATGRVLVTDLAEETSRVRIRYVTH